MAKFDIKDITGVIPALITTFDEHENFDEQRMRTVTRHLLNEGVDGFYLTGSTGETFLMTPEERRRVVEVVVDEVQGKVPVIVHVGDIGTKKSIEHAKHAYEAGADAISSVPPFYWRFSEDNIYNYYKDITESTPLPMIIYNIPLAGLVGYDTIKRLATIEGVKGIKYTATTHFEIMKIKQELGQDFMIYSGADEMAVSGLAFGADGIIGSFYNVIPELFQDIYKLMKQGDVNRAREKQEIANKIILKAVSYDYLALMKRMMAWGGVDAGYARKPFTNYSGECEESIKAEFSTIKKENNITDIKFMKEL
ncbi:dihydrodipicolinate synthase family protein [Hydrogenoanaerobacterium sp.]|uniref:dihydrodipicolinate synthase family protein n=1 Tax=Hydrogenoanaerobacterium sp. TaxID=2953763 RepID=UPI00289F7064|nr:dihydrodipicolinate synthase family protein [Hydrogenoanaerobacterium sp.]